MTRRERTRICYIAIGAIALVTVGLLYIIASRASEIVLVALITSVAPITTIVVTSRQQRREAKKDRDAATAARAEQIAETKRLSKLVDGHSTKQEQAITALKDALSKGGDVPQMPAAEAAPGQVTKDGDVVSVKPETTEGRRVDDPPKGAGHD